jgi:hypothetical protein
MTKRPRVEVRERSIFGESTTESLQDPSRDRFYLPGWSDKRRDWELAWRDYEKNMGPKPPPLPHRFQFVSHKDRMTANDRPDKVPEFAALGYRPVKGYEDYEKLTGQKLSDEQGRPLYNVRENEEGNLVVQSQMLMVCDADVAARNLAAERQRAARLEQMVEARAQKAAHEFNQALGLSKEGATDFEIGVIEDNS